MWASCWASRCPRLARSGREWHQLLELYALSGALLGDLYGVYDPAEHHDRLLLGLKGTISEAKLHLIRQRMCPGGSPRPGAASWESGDSCLGFASARREAGLVAGAGGG
jgi:hypothetical protein